VIWYYKNVLFWIITGQFLLLGCLPYMFALTEERQWMALGVVHLQPNGHSGILCESFLSSEATARSVRN
jgi:hypothetical protein